METTTKREEFNEQPYKETVDIPIEINYYKGEHFLAARILGQQTFLEIYTGYI